MTGDELLERVHSAFAPLLDKIQETPTYNQLKDRFDGLSLGGQRAVVGGAIALGFLLVLSIPYGWYSDSEVAVEEFNLKRETLRDLFKTTKELNEAPNIPVPPAVESLRMDIETRLHEYDVLPEQILNISARSGSSSRLIPSQRATGSVIAELKKLNLDQIVQIGTSLSRFGTAVKLTGVRVNANAEEAGYFDVTYTLATLAVPDLNSNDDSSGPRGNK